MIIGITGTDGAGKGSVVEYLVDKKGFVHYSSRELITVEIQTRGLAVRRENMRLVANEMRKTKGLDVIVQTAFESVKRDGVHDAIIESIRAVAEAKTLQDKGGILLTVDANPQTRYERIVSRQSESDQVSFTEFSAQEQLEMNDPDPSGMQKAEVIGMADYTIMNNGTFTELAEQIEVFLKTYND